MRTKTIFILVLAFFLGLTCSENNPTQSDNSVSNIQLIINSEPNNSHSFRLNKLTTINRVVVNVSGPDMNQISKLLTLNSDVSSASGKLDVPRGNSRTFTVEGIDGNSRVQFSGQTTKDIINDVESVAISVLWTPPDPVTLTISNVTSSTALLNWTVSSEPDFLDYRILVSTIPRLDVNTDKYSNDITDRNLTSITLTNLNPNTTYYVAVISTDTELWFTGNLDFNSSSNIVKSFSTTAASQTVVISYDDNSFENSLFSLEQNASLAVHFTSPSYPAKVIGMDLNIRGLQVFTALVIDFNAGNLLGSNIVTGVNPSSFFWASYDLSALNIIVNDDFFAGIRYSGTQELDGSWRPDISLDETSSARRSYFDSQLSGTISLIDDQGLPGNLAIRVTVEIGGELGKTVQLTPNLPLSSGISKVEDLSFSTLKSSMGH